MLEDISCIKNFTKIVYGFQTVCWSCTAAMKRDQENSLNESKIMR